MGKTQGGNGRYFAENYFLIIAAALLAVAAGPVSLLMTSMSMLLLGGALALCGAAIIFRGLCAMKETTFSAAVMVIAVGAIAVIGGGALALSGNKLMEMGNWPLGIGGILGALVIVFCGLSQRNKKNEPYAVGTKYEGRAKMFVRMVPVFLTLGGVVLLAASAVNMIEALSGNEITSRLVDSVLNYAGVVLSLIGIACWTSYLNSVKKALKESGLTVGDFKNGS